MIVRERRTIRLCTPVYSDIPVQTCGAVWWDNSSKHASDSFTLVQLSTGFLACPLDILSGKNKIIYFCFSVFHGDFHILTMWLLWLSSGYSWLFVIVKWLFMAICDCQVAIHGYLWLSSGYSWLLWFSNGYSWLKMLPCSKIAWV
jgi:hypothetical protein